MEIIPCKDRLEELVSFVARLNSDGAHHIGFFGEGEADIRLSLAEFQMLPGEAFRLAYEGDQLVGVFGVDVDHDVSRAWLFGPVVQHADWHSVADQLYAEVQPLIPADIRDYDVFCDVQNVRVESFAVRHGFQLRSENAVLTLARKDYTPAAKRKTQIALYQDEFFQPFETLHHELFPNAYYTARKIVEKINGEHQLFFAIEDARFMGYHFCKIEPEAESGYIDFIGTDSSARGRGIGADLLAAGVEWMLAAPATQNINLTVQADNAPARHLYEKFGFLIKRIMRGYRKKVA